VAPRPHPRAQAASIATDAARGQFSADDVAAALKMVLQLEGIACPPDEGLVAL